MRPIFCPDLPTATPRTRYGLDSCDPYFRLCELQTQFVGSAQYERSDQCRKLADQRWGRQQLVKEVTAAAQRKFTAYRKDTLCSVEVFGMGHRAG